MEDALGLANALEACPQDIPAALAMYEAKGQGRDRVVPARSNTPA